MMGQGTAILQSTNCCCSALRPPRTVLSTRHLWLCGQRARWMLHAWPAKATISAHRIVSRVHTPVEIASPYAAACSNCAFVPIMISMRSGLCRHFLPSRKLEFWNE